jgi:hypothetical protein
VQLPDLFATVLRAAGVEPPASPMPAHDLLAAEVPSTRPVLAEYYYPEQALGFLPEGAEESEAMQPWLRRIRTLIAGDDKLVWGSDGRHELYDLAVDPAERANRIESDPARAAELLDLLSAIVAPFDRPRGEDGPAARPSSDPLDPRIEEQLRALGYTR